MFWSDDRAGWEPAGDDRVPGAVPGEVAGREPIGADRGLEGLLEATPVDPEEGVGVEDHLDVASPGAPGEAVEAGVAPAGGGVAPVPVVPDPAGADEQFLSAVAAEFDAIEGALVRLDDGSFDRCQVCGGRISHEQLVADPLVTRCPVHA